MKLQFPFKDYTEEEILSVHGDERMRRLVANDTRTMDNISFLMLVFTVSALIGSTIYSLF